MGAKILIADGDRENLTLLHTVLASDGYDVLEASTGAEALFLIRSHCPDLILLETELTDRDGTEVLAEIRRWTSVPVAVVSSRTQEQQIVHALDMGADDYISKPFGTSELLARIRTALRHGQAMRENEDIASTGRFACGGLIIDYNGYRVSVDGRDVKLTQGEYRIVALLGRNAGHVLTYEAIMRQLWGPCARGDNKILRVNMTNIRKKIEPEPARPRYIVTVPGVGYRMACPDTDGPGKKT